MSMADTTEATGAILKILTGVQAGIDVALVEGSYTLGSGDDDDIQLFDVSLKPGALSEGEAWERLALAGRLKASGAHAGITVFLRGHLWDLGSDGRSLVVDGDGHTLAPDGPGARLINLWL